MSLFKRLFGGAKDTIEVPAPEVKQTMSTLQAMAMINDQKRIEEESKAARQLKAYIPPPGVIPEDRVKSALAMDSTPYGYLNANGITANGYGAFPGYPYLSNLAQLPEYRKITDTISEELTRKWIEFKYSGDTNHSPDHKAETIRKLEQAFDKYRIREVFRQVAQNDGYFGLGQIYIDVKTPSGGSAWDNQDELTKPLYMSNRKITKGSLQGFRVIEPIWTYPGVYNADNPLSPDYYRPSQWFVMGKTVDKSRMLTMRARPVPDILKAAYNFGGMSMSQLAEPYVQNWLRTRDSVSDLLHSFVVYGLKTDMKTILSGAVDPNIFARADLFNQTRDNRGLFLMDKEFEEFFQFQTSLSGVDKLQAQAQEQMASVSSIPLVKLLGITPQGLNASSEGEIRVFYDHIHAMQENLFRHSLQQVLEIIQLSEFGEIDAGISFEFLPLYELSEMERAEVAKHQSEADKNYAEAGVYSSAEIAEMRKVDKDSEYHLIDDLDIDEDDDDAEPQPEVEPERDTTQASKPKRQ